MITIPTNNDVTIFAEDVDMSAGFESEVLDCEHARNGSIHILWDGNDEADGVLSLLVSNVQDSGFGLMPDSEQIMAADGGDSHMWILTSEVFANRFIKVKYVAGSNTTGTISEMNITAAGRDRY